VREVASSNLAVPTIF